MNDKVLNEVFKFHHEKNELEKIEYLQEGVIVPKPRNSHGFIQSGDKAFIFGGANEEGPLNDAYELDLDSCKFKKIKLEDPAMTPYFEMHTAHLYQGDKLLLIGGRSHVLLH